MRVAVISDIHGNLPALEAVLNDIETQAVDETICLGDLAFKGASPAECIRRIQDMDIPCVYGNNDVYFLELANHPEKHNESFELFDEAKPYVQWHLDRMQTRDLDYLASLALEYTLELNDKHFLFVHGTPKSCFSAIFPWSEPEHIQTELEHQTADVIVMGHIHRPFMRRFEGKTLINTGSVSIPLDGDYRASYVVIEDDMHLSFRRVDYDVRLEEALAKQRDFCIPFEEYSLALRQGNWRFRPWKVSE